MILICRCRMQFKRDEAFYAHLEYYRKKANANGTKLRHGIQKSRVQVQIETEEKKREARRLRFWNGDT